MKKIARSLRGYSARRRALNPSRNLSAQGGRVVIPEVLEGFRE
jgi:hypothetical protein